MRTIPPAAVLAATLLIGLTPAARAGSALVIVVENNEKAGDDVSRTGPRLLRALAKPTEALLARAVRGELARMAADDDRSARAPSDRGAASPSRGTKPDAPKRSASGGAAPQLPGFLRDCVDEAGPWLLRDVLEPGIDRYGESFYAELLRIAAERYWEEVIVLTDQDARFERFAETVRSLDAKGHRIDVLINIHGSSAFTELDNGAGRGPDRLFFTGGSVTKDKVAALGEGRRLRLNAVYSTACWGSRFNEAWREAGAVAANGSRELNYYVLLSPLVFIHGFGSGLDLETASRRAYAMERRILDNEVLDEALAPVYGADGATRIQSARSSERVHAGERVRAACRAAAD